MQTPTPIKNHPVHFLLVALAIGFLAFSILCDVVLHATGEISWGVGALRALGLGIIFGLAVGVPDAIDWLALTGRAKLLGVYHLLFNTAALVFFGLSFSARLHGGLTDVGPFILSLFALSLMGAAGFLGGSYEYEDRAEPMEAKSPLSESVKRAI